MLKSLLYLQLKIWLEFLFFQSDKRGVFSAFTVAPRCGAIEPVNVDFLGGSIVRAGQKVYIRVYLPPATLRHSQIASNITQNLICLC